jgi:large subunit ribosomal protein L13
MKDTFVPSKDYITKKWYVIDATDQTLGRLATKASTILIGKEKATYTPYLDTGDYVIIVNAEKIKVSGKKRKNKNLSKSFGSTRGNENRNPFKTA